MENLTSLIMPLAETLSTGDLVKYILLIIGALGAFLVGMRMLQESTEKLATTGLKKLFSKTSNNRFIGVGIGALATMVMQSSGATTVMVVGFVNAGVMTLAQATTYIMGANIGTTITAQIVALGDLPISQVMVALTIVGVFLTMAFSKKNEKVSYFGNLIAGLGLLFLGLFVMTTYMKIIFNGMPQLTDWLSAITNPFILFLIGIVLTAAVQSSSAITSIVIAMAMAGVVIGGTGNGVLFLILGTNIGSTSTALLSAIGSTINGKRSAVIHFLFNVFGSLLFFVLLLCLPSFNELTFQKWFADSPQEQIAMFHTFFNLCCTLIFLPFVKIFVWLSEHIIPSKKGPDDNPDDVIDQRFLKNTAVAYSQAITYYHLIAKRALNDLNMAIDAFISKDSSKKQEIDDIQTEVLSMSRKLTGFIQQIITAGVSEEANIRLGKMQLDIADIIRLTEVADNMTGYTKHVVEDTLSFSPVVYNQLEEMKGLLNRQFKNSESIVEKPSLVLLVNSQGVENAIDDLRTQMIKEHMDRLSKGECKPENSNIFINLVGNLERCGDHFNFICERACDKISNATSAHA
ncbi:MAG: Na/Pi symporter [Bacilli bacterium]